MLCWYAVRTKPGAMRQLQRNETQPERTAVELELDTHGIHYYLPIERVEIRHHRTKKIIEMRKPLCPGYVFVADIVDWSLFDRLKWATGPIRIDSRPARIPDRDIEQIREAERLIRMAAAVKQSDTQRDIKRRFPAGTRVKITGEHPLKGQNAYVLETKGRKSIKAVISSLKAMQIELPVANVALVD